MPGCETGVMKVRERVIKEAYKLFDNSCEYFNPSNIDDETISQLNSLGESYEKLFRDSRLERVSNSGLVTTHSLLSLISPNDRALSEEMRMQKLRMFRKALFGDSDVGEEFLRQRNSGYDPSSSFFDSDLEASSNGNTEKSREGIPSGILKGVGCCLIGFLTLGFGSGALCPSKALAADNIYTPVGSHFSTGVSTDLTKNTSLDIDTQVKANEVVDLCFRGILGLGREEPFLYKFRIRAQPSKNFLIYTSLGRNKLTTSNELPWSIGAGFDMSEAVHIGCNLSNKEAVSKRGTLKDESEVCSALNLDVDLGKDKKIGAIGKYIGDEKIFGKNTGWGVGGYFGSNVPYKIMAILPWDDEFLMNSFLNNTSKDKITSYIGFDYSTKHPSLQLVWLF